MGHRISSLPGSLQCSRPPFLLWRTSRLCADAYHPSISWTRGWHKDSSCGRWRQQPSSSELRGRWTGMGTGDSKGEGEAREADVSSARGSVQPPHEPSLQPQARLSQQRRRAQPTKRNLAWRCPCRSPIHAGADLPSFRAQKCLIGSNGC